jgi:hypothetical protein
LLKTLKVPETQMLNCSNSYKNDQQAAILYDNLLFHCSALHVSNDIIAHHQEHLNCNYSFWFHSHVLLLAAVMAEPRQQPTAIHVNETRSCNYS